MSSSTFMARRTTDSAIKSERLYVSRPVRCRTSITARSTRKSSERRIRQPIVGQLLLSSSLTGRRFSLLFISEVIAGLSVRDLYRVPWCPILGFTGQRYNRYQVLSIVLASDIGLRLIDLRKATGLTQQDLARRAGRSKADTWRAWEQGGHTPNARFFEDLAEREGWPVGIFAEGGPVPSEVVNRAVNEKERKLLTQDRLQ